MNKYEEAGNKLLEQYGIVIKTIRKSMSGMAYIEDKAISSPVPKGAMSFAIFAHEVGHITLGQIKPRWLEELKAWEFSLFQFRQFGFPITQKVKQRFRLSMAYGLAKALNRGMKKIPIELKPFEKFLSPIVYLYGNGHKEQKWHADYRKIYTK